MYIIVIVHARISTDDGEKGAGHLGAEVIAADCDVLHSMAMIMVTQSPGKLIRGRHLIVRASSLGLLLSVRGSFCRSKLCCTGAS